MHDKNNAVHSDTTLNTAREAFEYGNQENICDGNKATDAYIIFSLRLFSETNLIILKKNYKQTPV